jgi:hypothetical protein
VAPGEAVDVGHAFRFKRPDDRSASRLSTHSTTRLQRSDTTCGK